MCGILFVVIFATMVLTCQAADLVPGTTSTYTEGGYTWAGNPGCYAGGFLLQPTSDAIDKGELIPGLHCPAAGPSSQFPPNADGSPCLEWYGAAPDIGACEYVGVVIVPPQPSGFPVVLNSTVSQPPEEATVTMTVVKPAGAVTATLILQVNDGEQCDEGKLYVNGNGPLQLWLASDFVADATDACRMSIRDGVDAQVIIKTDVSWWSDGANQVRFVHDKTSSTGFIVRSAEVGFGILPQPSVPTAPILSVH